MKIPFFIARRYLFSRKSRNVINYISFISGTIIAFVSLAMVLVLSTFNGIDNLVKDLYSTLDGPIEIFPTQGAFLKLNDSLQNSLDKIPELEVAGVLEGQVVLQSEKNQLVAKLQGVNPTFINKTKLEEVVNRGNISEFFNPSLRSILLGAGLHYHLKRGFEFPAIEPIVVLNIPKGAKLSSTSFGAFNKTPFAEVGTFTVTADYDLNYAFIAEDNFRKIFNLKSDKTYSKLLCFPDDQARLFDLKERLQKELGDTYSVKTRDEKNALLFQTSQSEKWVSFSILFFIVIVAAFNIVASLCILVLEKKKDLFVLKVIGLSEKEISLVFFFQSILINLLGLVLGIALGVALVLIQQEVGLLKLQGSVVEYYPVALKWGDILLIVFTILSIAAITFWPVNQLVKKLR